MLGDAAHPMTNAIGQGASQALEDAAVLVRCLASRADRAEALREYERLRQRRTRALVRLSRAMARLAIVQAPPAVTARDVFYRRMFPLAFGRQRKELSYDAGKA